MNSAEQDRRVFRRLFRSLERNELLFLSAGELILKIGKWFLGRPYWVGTLETEGDERLVVNLRGFDCFTFVENVVALVWCVKSRQKSFETFRRWLRQIRYRQGCLEGYTSRLHYFSDWIYDNQKKGIIRDVTGEIGGRPLKKTIHFMTRHPNLYPPLKDKDHLRKMRSVERTITKRRLTYIPKERLKSVEDRIADGDIIAVTTHLEGLDVQHVGFACRAKNRIHLVHASATEGKVVLSRQTLYRYLMETRTRCGIMVARIAGEAPRSGR